LREIKGKDGFAFIGLASCGV